jgi:hypothetical protein
MIVRRLPGDLDDMGGLSLMAALERLTLRRPAAVVPGGPDQQPTGVPRPGLGDRAFGVSRRWCPQTGPARGNSSAAPPSQSAELADLGVHADGGKGVDPAQASQPGDGVFPW